MTLFFFFLSNVVVQRNMNRFQLYKSLQTLPIKQSVKEMEAKDRSGSLHTETLLVPGDE